MEIINETTYSSEDINKLWEDICSDICAQRTAGTVHYQSQKWLPQTPEQLRIGYYNPTRTPDADPDPASTSYVKMTSRWQRYGSVPRLGIVKPAHLPLSPLQHLAVAGADEMYVPPVVVRQLAAAITYYLGEYGSADYPWLDSFKIRYKERAKRGSLSVAKRKSAQMRLERARRRRNDLEQAYREQLERAEETRKRLAACEARISKLEGQDA